MDRAEFECLRDLPGKEIIGDIVLRPNKENSPLLAMTAIIANSSDIEVKIRIEWNDQTDAKTLNVWIPGTGPICRLEVDSRSHHPYGRSHKHSLKHPDCSHPSINLSRDILDRADLAGKSIQEVFLDFCQKAHINHRGDFIVAD